MVLLSQWTMWGEVELGGLYTKPKGRGLSLLGWVVYTPKALGKGWVGFDFLYTEAKEEG